MIDHRPFGIDDPYKPLPVERFPRDPIAGDAVRIGFSAPEATSAHVELHGPDGASVHPAQALVGGLWTADLPPLPAGAWRYAIHARDAGGGASVAAFDLPVVRVRTVDRIERAEAHAGGFRLHLAGADGAAATLDLSSSTEGSLRVAFRVGAAPSEPAGDRPVRVAADADGWTLHGDGFEARLERASVALTVVRPGRPAARVRTGAAPAWLERPDGAVVGFRTRFDTEPGEPLHGLGERFDTPGLNGRTWDTRVYEEYKEQGRRTYLPVPFFVSARAWGAWLETDAPCRVDARDAGIAFEAEATPRPDAELVRHLIVADEPYAVTAAFVRLTGPIALPPRWAFGPWMSANPWNDQPKTMREVRRTLDEGVPATVLVIEAWSDESTFYVWNDAEFEPVPGDARLRAADFRFGGRWPDPKAMIDECHDEGIRVLLWQIPVLKQLDAPHPQHDADVAHALEHGYVIANGDGTPYRNQGWWFTDAHVFDATNPEARAWWFDKRRYLFEDLGIDGMKTDGGEHLWGRDLRAHDGSRGTELVNRYAQAYVDAYHGFVQSATGGDGLTFSRAGYTGAHRSPAHWAGDENSTWSAFRASIQAGVTAGLAGVSIWGWDIGGFSGEIPTVELYVRSAQMAAFCPVMQYHSELHPATENRDRTPWNVAERHGDPRALTIYRAYARLRMAMLDLIEADAAALAAEGRPLMRSPALTWPGRHDALLQDPDTYLFGRDLLVAPVLEKGAQARAVRLPPGAWIDLWSGVRFEGDRTVLVPAPLERIPVFVAADSPRLEAWRAAARSFEVA